MGIGQMPIEEAKRRAGILGGGKQFLTSAVNRKRTRQHKKIMIIP